MVALVAENKGIAGLVDLLRGAQTIDANRREPRFQALRGSGLQRELDVASPVFPPANLESLLRISLRRVRRRLRGLRITPFLPADVEIVEIGEDALASSRYTRSVAGCLESIFRYAGLSCRFVVLDMAA